MPANKRRISPPTPHARGSQPRRGFPADAVEPLALAVKKNRGRSDFVAAPAEESSTMWVAFAIAISLLQSK
jgi:hypothetical protein